MNAERLLAHYEQIADAPDAVARLRRFILDLAVRGKLVPQDASEEPASELLRRIGKSRTRQLKAGTIKREVHLDAIGSSERPFDIPAQWEWARLNDLTELVYGKLLPTNELLAVGFDVFGANGVIGKYSRYLYSEPMLLISCRGAYSGTPNISPPQCYVTNNSIVCELFEPACFNIRYLHSVLSISSREAIVTGTAQPQVTIANAIKLPIPLPPLAEQHRIVAKVDELMGLCDRLEAARAGREGVRDRLAAASLARLNAPDPETFQADARFALAALPALTTRPDQIKTLRQTILNLAVRGKLVPQDANDEPASELLKRIARERADLVGKKEIRREDSLDPIQPADMPFEVPESWVWSRIGEAVLFTQYGTSQKSNPSEKGVPVLTMGNVQEGLVVWNNEKRIPETSEDLPMLYLRKFDLLYNRTNSAELVGKTGIYLGEDGVRTFASYLIRLRPSHLYSNPQFLNMAMNTPEFRETQIVPLIKKQTGQANVNGTALKNMLIPLPPLAEQHRIVAKVDALMALCDRLEASLTATAATRRRLLDALLAEALAPAPSGDRHAAANRLKLAER